VPGISISQSESLDRSSLAWSPFFRLFTRVAGFVLS
jgi:hypothetical protein